jgi:hypothetical protein
MLKPLLIGGADVTLRKDPHPIGIRSLLNRRDPGLEHKVDVLLELTDKGRRKRC